MAVYTVPYMANYTAACTAVHGCLTAVYGPHIYTVNHKNVAVDF